MKIRHFLKRVEHDRIHRAIQAAEQGTSGRIVVYVSHHEESDAVEEAHHIFRKLRLESAKEHTGLLIFLAPRSRTFAVVGGTALHEKRGQAWWDHLTALISRHFREDRYTDGLLAVVEDVGTVLKSDFPASFSARPRENDIIEE